MQEPAKKSTKPNIPRWIWIPVLMILIIGIGIWVFHEEDTDVNDLSLPIEKTDGNIIVRDPSEVAGITITPAEGEAWSVTRTADGMLKLDGVSDWNVDPAISEMLLETAAVVCYEEVLSEDPAEYADHPEEFGLDNPLVIAAFRYTDGTECTIRIGMESVIDEETYFYMTVDGDERLFAVDYGTVQVLTTEKQLLHPVEQVGINPNRIDRIEVEDSDGHIRSGWRLEGKVTDEHSVEEWIVTAPIEYPADQDRMNELLQNTGNLYLGAYVGEALPENLKACGLEDPEAVIVLHMASGSTGSITDDGQYVVTEQPEQTVRFDVGATKNELVRYVCYQGSIYTMNSFQLDVFLNADGAATANRYPVSVPFDQLASVTVEKDGETHEYALTHDWTTDDDGNTIHNGECLRDGTEIEYGAFEAAYERLRVVTVSGRITEQENDAGEDEYMKYTFRTLNGETHTAAFIQMDIYHDIVVCDGYALFYIYRGNMTGLP